MRTMRDGWRQSRGSTTAGFVLGIAIAAIGAGLVVWLLRSTGIHIDTSRPTVIQRIQQLQRLETVVYGMDKIVAGGQESRYFPKLLVGDRLLLIVYGEAIAGVDLAKVNPEEVE